MRHFVWLFVVLLATAGCSSGNRDLVVVGKEIHREQLSQSVAGDQFGSAAGSVIENSVIGKIKNSGSEEARDVELTFHVSGGGQNFALVAHIPSIPAGATVGFRTRGVTTPYTLQFGNDGEPEITVGKQK
jgi:hypothetical protein